MNDVKVNNATESTKILIEVKKILELDKDNKDALVLQQKLVSINTSFEQGIAIVKKVTETQTSNLNREKYFSDKNVSFTGLLSMIKKEQ